MLKGFRQYSLITLCLVASVGQVPSQVPSRTAQNKTTPPFECTKRIEANELKLLLDDIRAKNPEALKRLDADAGLRQKQVENLRQLLAFACQAVKDGAADDAANRAELESIRNEIVAMEFDKISDKRPSHAPFDSITDARIADFYKVSGNEAAFDEFLKAKVELLKRSGTLAAGKEVSIDETEQAKEYFAKIRISEADSKLKALAIEPNFWIKTGLQIRLQQAQFLARIYSEKVADKTTVSDAEIDEFIKGNPEFDPAAKRKKAEGILIRAKAGEDFAALADEYSDDPGNLDTKGGKHGGLYKDVPKGRMLPAFESAALALNPGEVSPVLTETDYGYHIIKLEKKSDVKQPDGTTELTYDVRHILISTTQKDPANPSARELPVKEFVRNKLEAQKESDIVAKIVAANQIEVAPYPVAVPAAKKQPARHRRTRRRK